MPKPAIIEPNQSYTFSNYFELQVEPEALLGYFGYSLVKGFLELPQGTYDKEEVRKLKRKMIERLPKISFSAEIARREVLVSPVLLSLTDWLDIRVKIEYPLRVTEQLKGVLDYYISSNNNLLIIEAKREDLDNGFNQLAVELIALQQWLETDKVLYGALTTGTIWQFGILNPVAKQVAQDLQLYRVPADLEELFSILVGILK